MKYQETARRLTEALNRKRLLPSELAQLSGVSKASISQYMNGTHAPSNLSSEKMAKVLSVNPLWLMGFDLPEPTSQHILIDIYDALNAQGQEKLLDYAQDLAASGRYKKHDSISEEA